MIPYWGHTKASDKNYFRLSWGGGGQRRKCTAEVALCSSINGITAGNVLIDITAPRRRRTYINNSESKTYCSIFKCKYVLETEKCLVIFEKYKNHVNLTT